MDRLCRGEICLLSFEKVIDVPCSSGEYLLTERGNSFFEGSRRIAGNSRRGSGRG